MLPSAQRLSESPCYCYNAPLTQRPYLFPSFRRGFDSHRPLHKSRCFYCPYAAKLFEFALKMCLFGPQMDPNPFNWTRLRAALACLVDSEQ